MSGNNENSDTSFQQTTISHFHQCVGRLEGKMGKDYSGIVNELKILFLDGVEFGLDAAKNVERYVPPTLPPTGKS